MRPKTLRRVEVGRLRVPRVVVALLVSAAAAEVRGIRCSAESERRRNVKNRRAGDRVRVGAAESDELESLARVQRLYEPVVGQDAVVVAGVEVVALLNARIDRRQFETAELTVVRRIERRVEISGHKRVLRGELPGELSLIALRIGGNGKLLRRAARNCERAGR